MEFLIDLAIMLIFAKLVGDLFEILKFPESFGAILAGFLMGPVLGIIDVANIEQFAQVGLVLLLFITGFEEIKGHKLLKNIKPAALTGILGAMVPFFAGYLLGITFGYSELTSLFIGVALSGTSISITVSSFIAAKKIDTRVGKTALAASIIDDIAGLIFIALLVSMITSGTTISAIGLLKIVGGIILFGIIFIIGEHIIPWIFNHLNVLIVEEIKFSVTLALVLIMAFIAHSFGLSALLGAFVAGIILSKVPQLETKLFVKEIDVVSEGIFVPLFFAWVGLQLTFVPEAISMFTLWLIIIAVLTKFLAAFFSGKICRFSSKESTILGFGMIPRGEFCLITLMIGKQAGVIPENVFAAMFLMILVTTILTPLLLRTVVGRLQGGVQKKLSTYY